MVFVTVGTATQSFRRLLEGVDRLAGGGFFNGEPVFMQTGSSRDFVPEHCQWMPFVPRDEFSRVLRDAGLIICHGGATVLEMVRLAKVPVVMPRRKKYGEHVNDHQLELVQLLASEGRIVLAWEPEDLPGAIQEARRRAPLPVPVAQMMALVGEAIVELTRDGLGWR